MRWRLSDFAVIGLLAVLAGATALMQNVPRTPPIAAHDIAIRQVIGWQIEAFRLRRHAAAFGFVTPELQDQFGTIDAFITMVQANYRPVYHAHNFDFTGPTTQVAAHQRMRIQRVFITDDRGAGHTARYIMQKQPDGSWKIAGCQLLVSPQLEI